MLPKLNPHFLPPSTTPVSRKDLFSDNEGGYTSDALRESQATSLLVSQLNQIIRTSLANSSLDLEPSDRRKRRKVVPESIGLTEPLCMFCV
jgi:hypothetical protein